MDLSYSALSSGIADQLAAVKITKLAMAKDVATSLLLHKARFIAVQSATGVPALWMMPVFYREGGKGFGAYFGNGDPLNEVTKDVPRGRGPFATWEEGAIDALNLDHITHVQGWDWVRAVYQWISWNGFGSDLHGRPSAYAWAGTNQYHGGMFIHDGPGGWSPRTWDPRVGCVAVAKILAAEDNELAAGFEAVVASASILTTTPATATAIT